MGMEFEDRIVFEGCRTGYCDYDPATGIYVGYIVF